MPLVHKIAPCLWFDNNGEEAARFYVGIFRNSKIVKILHYGEAGKEVHGRAAGSVMTVSFELEGQPFTALNGGPQPTFKFNEGISFEVHCDTQADIDYYWEKLGAGGDPKAQQCGWLKDKYGVSWQVVPKNLDRLFDDPKSTGYARVMDAMLKMKKLNIADIETAYKG